MSSAEFKREPRGRKSDKPWRDALLFAVTEKDADGQRKLRQIAEKCVAAALAGDMTAIQEIGNRIDGKPRQEIEHSGEVQHSVIRAPQPSPSSEQWLQQRQPPTLLQ